MGEPMIKAGQVPKLLGALLFQQSLFLAAGAALWIWAGQPFESFVPFGWYDVLLGLALTVGLIALHQMIVLLWPAGNRRLAEEMGGSVFSTERPYDLGAILVISLSAGIGEEALFRGGIQTFAGLYMPGWAAILVATAVFTAAHPGSRAFMICVAVLSLIFGSVYAWTGSLLGVMIAHALYDIFACLWTQRELRRLGHWVQPVVEPGAAAAEPNA